MIIRQVFLPVLLPCHSEERSDEESDCFNFYYSHGGCRSRCCKILRFAQDDTGGRLRMTGWRGAPLTAPASAPWLPCHSETSPSPVILRSGATKNLIASTSTIRMVVVGTGVVRSFASLRMTRGAAQDDTGSAQKNEPPLRVVRSLTLICIYYNVYLTSRRPSSPRSSSGRRRRS